MEIYVGIKRNLQFLGIFQFDHPRKKTFKNVILKISSLCVFITGFLAIFWFFCFEAKTFADKILSIAEAFYVVCMIMAYCILRWQRERFLELITRFESKIEERMLWSMKIKKKNLFT